MSEPTEEFACIEPGHYIHLGENGEGRPCNSSIMPIAEQGKEDAGNWWSCLGCGCWWPTMPELPQEGLAVIGKMRPLPEEEIE